MTAWVYFGQLKAVVGALSGQVTFNTPARWLDEEPARCALTVVFKGVAKPTGAVYAQGLATGWLGLESTPSQDTENGTLHQQIVTAPETLLAGQSWQFSAEMIAGNQTLTSNTYLLQFQSAIRSEQRWLVNGQAVACSA